MRRFTVDDMWAIPRVGGPVPSPDGKRFVVPVTTFSMKTNEGTTQLWLEPDHRALTTAEKDSGQPAISPDGKRLAFVRKPGGKRSYPEQPQLHVMPLDGGEPECLTDLPLGAADPRWFPDGKRIAFLVPLLADALSVEGTGKRQKECDEDPVKARVTEDRVYRYWDKWLTDGRVHHLYMLDLATRELTDLTPGSRRWFDLMDPSNQYQISPDGREVAFSACRTRPPHDPVFWGVFTVSVAGRKCLHITAEATADALRPVYSPDGRWIVYGQQRDPDFYADRVRLVAYDRKRKQSTVLTEDWDRSAEAWLFAGDRLYVLAEDEGRTAIFVLDPRKRLSPRRVVRGGTFGGLQAAGDRLFMTRDSLSEPPEVVTVGLDGRGMRKQTCFTSQAVRDLEFGKVEEDFFVGAEGDRVQMWIVHPPGKRSRKRLPLVHMIHGGPQGVFGDNWHWRWNAQAFAAPGYVVAQVNFHGSTSWGQRFAECIQGRWGDQPFVDIMKATDRLIERGLADRKRMAATGGSYGGYMAAWIASQTDRFACVVNHAGVGDLQMEWASDVTQGWHKALGGTPWGDLAGMDRWSPMRQARGFRSPMLVIHGERDYRVPYDQGLQIYNIYKAMRRPARLVCYPDENHWILKPRNSRHWYGEVLGWLKRWLR